MEDFLNQIVDLLFVGELFRGLGTGRSLPRMHAVAGIRFYLPGVGGAGVCFKRRLVNERSRAISASMSRLSVDSRGREGEVWDRERRRLPQASVPLGLRPRLTVRGLFRGAGAAGIRALVGSLGTGILPRSAAPRASASTPGKVGAGVSRPTASVPQASPSTPGERRSGPDSGAAPCLTVHLLVMPGEV